MAVPVYRSLDDAVRACSDKGYFIKQVSIEMAASIDAEEEGLNAMCSTGVVRTPEIYCKGTDPGRCIAFLITEMIDSRQPDSESLSVLGRNFAMMHLCDAENFVQGGKYGFLHDNYIGASVQINTPKDSWIDFFRECRLKPQFRMAEKAFDSRATKDILKLMDRLDDLLIEPEHPSLLHGDMWGGNHLIDRNGEPVLIDPAAYVGHSEADLAMTEMFSPFPRAFYDGYYEVLPMKNGYSDRRDIYNLYHTLNHYNIFGGSYLMSALRIIRRFTG